MGVRAASRRQPTIRAFPASLSYAIVYSGKPPTKPAEFRVRVSTGAGDGVTIWMWNQAHKFKRSFRQKFKLGLRMRLATDSSRSNPVWFFMARRTCVRTRSPPSFKHRASIRRGRQTYRKTHFVVMRRIGPRAPDR
jgi:hypothetical protein